MVFSHILLAIFFAVTSALVTQASFFVRRPSLLSMIAAKDFTVRVINKKKNMDTTLQVPSNKFILDVAEQSAGNLIPYSCRAGSCSSCLGKLIEGTVDQSNQIFLEDDKIDEGYMLTCVALPTSNVVIEVNIEEEFYK